MGECDASTVSHRHEHNCNNDLFLWRLRARRSSFSFSCPLQKQPHHQKIPHNTSNDVCFIVYSKAASKLNTRTVPFEQTARYHLIILMKRHLQDPAQSGGTRHKQPFTQLTQKGLDENNIWGLKDHGQPQHKTASTSESVHHSGCNAHLKERKPTTTKNNYTHHSQRWRYMHHSPYPPPPILRRASTVSTEYRDYIFWEELPFPARGRVMAVGGCFDPALHKNSSKDNNNKKMRHTHRTKMYQKQVLPSYASTSTVPGYQNIHQADATITIQRPTAAVDPTSQ